MNGSALRAKRRTLYLTSEDLAGFLQVDEETVALWEADQEVIPLGIQHGILMLEFKLQADYENNSDEYRQLVGHLACELPFSHAARRWRTAATKRTPTSRPRCKKHKRSRLATPKLSRSSPGDRSGGTRR
jgi:hypothetical protein